MAKLRNAGSELSMFTEWLGRKCRNHNPLAELNMTSSERRATANIYKSSSRGSVERITDDDGNVLLYQAKGRTFKITVEELDLQEYEAMSDHAKVKVRH